MSVSDFLRNVWDALCDMLRGIAGWVIVAPICTLIPKRKDWIAVIGREDGKFVDNTKYFFIETVTDPACNLRVVHVGERQDVVAIITEAGFEAMCYPSLRAAWFLARCGTVVVDSTEWFMRWRRFLLVRARLIQLWHGVGFKRIELDKWCNEAPLRSVVASKWMLLPRLLRRYISGRVPRYDAVVTTSRFYADNVFSVAFRSRQVLTTGYPRNGFSATHPLAWVNVDPVIRRKRNDWKQSARKLVLVAPTFRDSRATPLQLDAEQIAAIDTFCAEHGFEFLFKFHPYEHGTSAISGRHLHVLDPRSDVYPLLPYVSFMVTDYSSIYMDFLLLDRPILFFTPDLEQYLSHDRSIQFSFESMTPGPKLNEWKSVLQLLLEPEAPEWMEMRRNLRSLAFDDNDQKASTRRLLKYAEEQGWITSLNRRAKALSGREVTGR